MRVLVACEFSGIVRDAFRARGHEAYSVDLLPTEGDPVFHHVGDVLPIAYQRNYWDLMIAHPPCTFLAVSGARWFKDRIEEQEEALVFVEALLDAPIPRIALENPVGIISTRIRKPDQIVHPFHFGDPVRKSTCWWLKGLPKLNYTKIIWNAKDDIHCMAPGPNRSQDRSRTFPGMADAMAAQWGAI